MANIIDVELFKCEAGTILDAEQKRGNNLMKYDAFCAKMKLTYGTDIKDLAKEAKFHCGKDFLHKNGFMLNEDGDLIINPLDENGSSTSKAAAASVAAQSITDSLPTKNEYFDFSENHFTRARPFPNPFNRDANTSQSTSAAAQSNVSSAYVAGLINDYLPAPPKKEYFDVTRAPPLPNPFTEVHDFDGDVSKLHPGMRVRIATGFIHHLPTIPQYLSKNEKTQKLQFYAGKKYAAKVRELVRMHTTYKNTIAMMYSKK